MGNAVLAIPAHVRLSISNLLGQKIAVLLDGDKAEGTHQIQWDGVDGHRSPAPAGVYLYRLEAGTHHGIGKLLLLK